MVVLDEKLFSLTLIIRILVFTVVCTGFEYLIGLFYEKVFHLRLWDYSKKRFNIKGRICLKNTLLWAFLVTVFLLYIQPFVDGLIARYLSGPLLRYLSYGIALMTLADAASSTLELKSTADFINKFRERFSFRDPAALRSAIGAMSNRFISQFPNLRLLASEATQRFFAEDLLDPDSDSIVMKISHILKERSTDEADMDPDYVDAVRDLLCEEHVRAMATLPHHDASVLDHSLQVSQVAFVVAQRYGLDAVSAARGALLHDFFLYDWQKEKVPHHATGHAKTALANARKYFDLNEVEADCILTHMWPLSRHFYRYRESFIVSLIDKFVSAHEMAGVDFPELIKKLLMKRFGTEERK